MQAEVRFFVRFYKKLCPTTKFCNNFPLRCTTIENMNVYVEYVVLDNFVLDFLLLFAAAKTLKLPFKIWRIVLGAAVGALCAVVSVWVKGAWTYFVKAACLAAMCFVAVGWGKKLFWYILLTCAYTFVLGGAVVGLFNLFNIDYLNSDGQFYEMRVPLFVYVLAVAAAAFLCYSIVAYLRQAKKILPHTVKITVQLDKSYAALGFCDSGNTLCHNGVPVCFVTKKFGGFADYFAKQVLGGNAVDVTVATVAGSKTVKAVEARVVANGKDSKVYLALPADKCQTIYNILLSNEFCGG